MSSFFTFALVVLLIALILIAFAIANVVYYNQFKSGTALTQNQLTGLVVINALAIILLLIIFFYAIFAAVEARKIDTKTSLLEANGVLPGTGEGITPMLSSVPPSAPIYAPVPVSAPMSAPVIVSAPPAFNSTLPKNVQLVGSAPTGTTLYRATADTTIRAGQLVCLPPS